MMCIKSAALSEAERQGTSNAKLGESIWCRSRQVGTKKTVM